MTKKRFVKLTMSRGYDRNTALILAQEVREMGYSYDMAYCILISQELIGEIADKIQKWTNEIVSVVSKIGEAVCNGIQAFMEEVTRTLSQ